MSNEGQPIPLNFPAGFYRRGTPLMTQGRWRDGNMVRFDPDASLRSIGGWLLVSLVNEVGTSVDIAGTARSAFAWRDNLSRVWVAIGTTQKLYAWDGNNLYDITPAGIQLPGEDVGVVYGYGTGSYNTGSYNTAIGSGTTSNSSAAKIYGYWHLENWGENLLASIDSDGKVYEWNPNAPGTDAAVVTNAPQYAIGVGVTNERHVVVIGAKVDIGGGSFRPAPRRVQWSNEEDNTVWAADPLNLAGELELDSNGVCLRLLRFGAETLIFTDADVHRMEYLGYPDVYRLRKLAGDCGLTCPAAVAYSSNRVFWVGPRGFFLYDGNSVQTIDCPLFETAGEGAALLGRNGKLTVGHNKLFNEFVIHYSTTENGNPDRYILWNYVDNVWVDGDLDRSFWYDSPLLDYPIAGQPFTGTKTRLYKHEVGEARPNYTFVDEANSAPMMLGTGQQFLEVDRFYQDADINRRQRLRIGFSFYRAPNLSPLKTIPATELDETRGYTDIRGTGKLMSVTVSTADAGGGRWRMGRMQVRGKAGEQR